MAGKEKAGSPNREARQANSNAFRNPGMAQVQAMLALAYEQRTANMIAYANMNTETDPWLVEEVRNRIWNTTEEVTE